MRTKVPTLCDICGKSHADYFACDLDQEPRFEQYEAVVFDPKGWLVEDYPGHPLSRNELVYYLGEIPNVPGHCIVVKYSGITVPMIHPGDLRKATEEEL